MNIDPMELDPLDPSSPLAKKVDFGILGRSGIVTRRLRIEATESERRPSPSHRAPDPAVPFDRIAAACIVGCFGARAEAKLTLVRSQMIPRVAVAGELTLGPTHPGVLRCLARMAHGADLSRLRVVESAEPSELVDVANLPELAKPAPSFAISGRKSVDEKTHAIELGLTASDQALPAVREIVLAWSGLVELGAFRGHHAPWSTGFLVEVARAGRESIVATFEFLNLHATGFDPLILALSQMPGTSTIRSLELS